MISTRLLKRWIFHSAFIWIITHSFALLFYFFRNSREVVEIEGASQNIFKRLLVLNLEERVPLLILIIVFLVELNYSLFIRKTIIRFLLGCTFSGILGTGLLYWTSSAQAIISLDFIIQSFLLIAGYTFVYPAISEMVREKIFRPERLYREVEAELRALKSQLNPHFFFNTLNGLYSMALDENASKTSKGIEQLSGMMRYVLENDQTQLTPLDKEIRFIRQYIYLQQMRLPQMINKKIQVEIEVEKRDYRVPHLLFIPLIENAFKYGISYESEVEIQLKIFTTEKKLIFNMANKIIHQKEGMKTGIKNLKRRLDLLLSNKYRLDIIEKDDFYRVNLEIKMTKEKFIA